MFVTLLVHHPHPARREDFLGSRERVVGAIQHAPGLIEFTCCAGAAGERQLGRARGQSAKVFHEARPTIPRLSEARRPAWAVADKELLTLADRRGRE